MRAEGRKRASVGSILQKFVSRLRDYAELTKARITTLIVLTAWCGYFFGAHKLGVSSWSLGSSMPCWVWRWFRAERRR